MKFRKYNVFQLQCVVVASLLLVACATYGQRSGQSMTIRTSRVVAAP
jgi:hypothetical protein